MFGIELSQLGMLVTSNIKKSLSGGGLGELIVRTHLSRIRF